MTGSGPRTCSWSPPRRAALRVDPDRDLDGSAPTPSNGPDQDDLAVGDARVGVDAAAAAAAGAGPAPVPSGDGTGETPAARRRT